MKRRVALGILLLTLLAGCAPRPAATPAATATPASPTAPAAPPTLPPTLAPPTATPAPTVPPTVPPLTAYTVQPGDTLLGLAMRFGVPMAALQLQNGMGDSTTLYAGQSLVIPPPVGWEAASPFWVVHRVQPGETLTGIGQAVGVSVAALQAVNGLGDADQLAVGQALVLPLSGPLAAVQPTPRPTSAPAASATVAPATATSPPPVAPPAPPPGDVAAWPAEVARLINEVRAAHGLPPLAYHAALAAAAQGQANDCAGRGWCSHTGSDGSDAHTRILRAGYTGSGWAECWAQSLTPRGAVEMWMDETPPNDPHRRTLLSTWLADVGVGVAQTSWGYYFIADFGRP